MTRASNQHHGSEERGSRRAISLRWELAEVASAVDARLLLDQLSFDLRGNEPIVREAERGARGVLSLVEARLQLIGSVIGGEAEFRHLLSRHNILDEVPEEGEPDVFIGERPAQEATFRHRRWARGNQSSPNHGGDGSDA